MIEARNHLLDQVAHSAQLLNNEAEAAIRHLKLAKECIEGITSKIIWTTGSSLNYLQAFGFFSLSFLGSKIPSSVMKAVIRLAGTMSCFGLGTSTPCWVRSWNMVS